MEFTAKIREPKTDYNGECIVASFETHDYKEVRKCYDDLHDKELIVTVTRKLSKRSKEANNYAWTLIQKIANATGSSKDETYSELLASYGQLEVNSFTTTDEEGNTEIQEDPIIITLRADVNPKNYTIFKHIYAFETFFDNCGNEMINYYVPRGSSSYDTHEMSIFIDGIVSEAKVLGIETLTPEELARIKEDWK